MGRLNRGRRLTNCGFEQSNEAAAAFWARLAADRVDGDEVECECDCDAADDDDAAALSAARLEANDEDEADDDDDEEEPPTALRRTAFGSNFF